MPTQQTRRPRLTVGVSVLMAFFTLGLTSAVSAPEAPVADAAMSRDVEAVRTALANGADVNASQGDGMTGLHWAARYGNEEVAVMLIDAGASVDAATRIGAHQPIHVASRLGHANVVRKLLEAGADASARTLIGTEALHFAASSGDAATIRALLEHGANPDAREPAWEQTPLMYAAALGRVAAIDALLKAGADPEASAKVLDIAARDSQDREAQLRRRERIIAIRAGEAVPEADVAPPPPSAEELRAAALAQEEADRNGGEPQPLNYGDLVGTHGGLTPLLLAAREGQVGAVRRLLEGGAGINTQGVGDQTSPLLMATINGHFDLAMELLELGADPTLTSVAGATPLYGALNMNWAPKARHPQPTDYMQQTVGYLELMKAFLDAGVDPNARLTKTLWFTTYNRDLLGVDRTGATTFWRAAHALDIEAMQLLLAYGAEPGLPTTKVPARRFRRSSGEDLSGLLPIPMGGPAVFPIHAASGVGHGQGFAGNSHRYVPDGWLNAVKFLVEELGADVNARDHNGYTPSHHAAARGDNELILYLVEKGADVTLMARSGQSTVDMANGPVQRIEPFPETIALLEELGAKNNHRCVSC
jgi:ankyrin repeat protein